MLARDHIKGGPRERTRPGGRRAFQICEAGRCGGVQREGICFGLTPAVKIKACVLLRLNACSWFVVLLRGGMLKRFRCQVPLVTGRFWINKVIYVHL